MAGGGIQAPGKAQVADEPALRKNSFPEELEGDFFPKEPGMYWVAVLTSRPWLCHILHPSYDTLVAGFVNWPLNGCLTNCRSSSCLVLLPGF